MLKINNSWVHKHFFQRFLSNPLTSNLSIGRGLYKCLMCEHCPPGGCDAVMCGVTTILGQPRQAPVTLIAGLTGPARLLCTLHWGTLRVYLLHWKKDGGRKLLISLLVWQKMVANYIFMCELLDFGHIFYSKKSIGGLFYHKTALVKVHISNRSGWWLQI